MDHAVPTGRIAGPGFEIERDAWGRLVLMDERGRHVGVDPVRSFPISEPGRWISLCDSEGHELAFLESLDGVSPELRTLLLAELARREFLPVIRRVNHVDANTIPELWDVETDRGPIRFSLDGDENARMIGPHRALIVDSRGIRFHIPDVRALDLHSRRILERYL